jgi:hypothetical protein
MVTAESPASRVSHITLGRKRAGKPIAGNRHDGFEVAGAGTQLTVWLMRHSQRKRGATDRLNLRSMAPVLDPTREACTTATTGLPNRGQSSVAKFLHPYKYRYAARAFLRERILALEGEGITWMGQP